MSIDVYATLKQAYLAGRPPSEYGSHLLSAFLERQVRLAACLAVAHPSSGGVRPVLPRLGGLGSYLRLLEVMQDNLSNEESGLAAAEMCESITVATGRTKSSHPELADIQAYRNYLMHGGLEPSGGNLAVALQRATGEVGRAVERFLAAEQGVSVIGGELEFGTGGKLWPLLLLENDHLAFFHGVDKTSVEYHSLDLDAPQLTFDAHTVIAQRISGYLEKGKSGQDRQVVESFQSNIKKDLLGFRDASVPIENEGFDSPFKTRWARRTSSGSETRTDIFRVGIDHGRHWRSASGWVPYSEFLRDVSNWNVSVTRLFTRLKITHATAAEADRKNFEGGADFLVPEDVVARFERKDLLGAPHAASPEVKGVALAAVADEAAGNLRGVPQVFFVTGEAGIGKTFNLLRTSVRRASAVTSGSSLPFYLYIDCSGRGLRSLEDLINAAVVSSQNLDYTSVLALCRNGLLVLVVDGFDELLGGQGYRDAFHLLGPMLRELGTRGAIILSARSSYATNQYRSSLAATSALTQSPADHTVLELQRWSRGDLDAVFANTPQWQQLRTKLVPSDFDLLGVPFFARTLHGFLQVDPDLASFEGLRQVLVDSYIDRELGKLAEYGGGRSVTALELRQIFVELSGLLYESSSSALDLDEFTLACATALGVDGFQGENRALGDRLTVLCGLSVESVGLQGSLFSFQHEVFQEVFLAHYLRTRFEGAVGRSVLYSTALSKSILGDAVVDALIDEYPELVTTALGHVANFVESQDSTLAVNFAALFARLLETRSILGSAFIQNISSPQLDLGRLEVSILELSACKIDVLRLDAGSIENVRLSSCVIDRLEISGRDFSRLERLRVDGSSRVQELLLRPTEVAATPVFIAGQYDVLERLHTLGVKGLEKRMQVLAPVRPSNLEQFADEVLGKLASRGETAYVIEVKLQVPADSARQGTPQPNNPMWKPLTAALVDSGLVIGKALNASGVAKTIYTFALMPEKIVDRNQSDPRVAKFWSAAAAS